MECAYCGSDFVVNRKGTRFCSHSCAEFARAEREEAAGIETKRVLKRAEMEMFAALSHSEKEEYLLLQLLKRDAVIWKKHYRTFDKAESHEFQEAAE